MVVLTSEGLKIGKKSYDRKGKGKGMGKGNEKGKREGK